MSPRSEATVDVWSGALQVRLAETMADIDAAQALRYRVFYREMGARPTPEMARTGRDFDAFDADCDHLLVIDHARDAAVVGTYRLIRRSMAQRHRGFYSAGEYDIAPLEAYPGKLLELGRSCVDAARAQPADHAVAVARHRRLCLRTRHRGHVRLRQPARHRHRRARGAALLSSPPPPGAERNCGRGRCPAVMSRCPGCERGSYDAARARAAVPPLIKGYLRLGGFVGEGAVIDHQFNTTDVCVVVQTELVTEKYYRHYERQVREDAAL